MKMTEKVPVNLCNGEGNSCPVCGSYRVSVINAYLVEQEEDINSGVEIFRDPDGKRAKKTYKRMAKKYRDATGNYPLCWRYQCRKCGWKSKLLSEQGVEE